MGNISVKRKMYLLMSIMVVSAIVFTQSGCLRSDTSRYKDAPEVTGDGSGGVIVVWSDEKDVHIQKIDSHGKCFWGDEGRQTYTYSKYPVSPLVVEDNNGGVILAWTDENPNSGGMPQWGVYAQRLNVQGNAVWPEGGISISAGPFDVNRGHVEMINESLIALVNDGDGGSILLWYNEQKTSDSWKTTVHAQRINADGDFIWGEQGIQVCGTSPDPRWAKLVSDGSGGAIVLWEDSRRDDYDIYAQRISYNGDLMWSNDGIPLADFEGAQIQPEIISSGADSFIVAWLDCGGSQYNIGQNQIVVQKINLYGKKLWAKEGIKLSSTSFSLGNQTGPHLSNDGSGGCIVVWHDDRDRLNRDVYAQRLDYQGNRLWGNDGMLIWNRAGVEASSLRAGSYEIKIARDNNSDVIIVWQVNPEAIAVNGFKGGQIFAQKLSITGEFLWGEDGLKVYNNPSLRSQGYSSVVSDGMGGIIISSRVGKKNVPNLVYAQRIDSNGRRLWGEGGIRID
jgi:hypothetical protein